MLEFDPRNPLRLIIHADNPSFVDFVDVFGVKPRMTETGARLVARLVGLKGLDLCTAAAIILAAYRIRWLREYLGTLLGEKISHRVAGAAAFLLATCRSVRVEVGLAPASIAVNAVILERVRYELPMSVVWGRWCTPGDCKTIIDAIAARLAATVSHAEDFVMVAAWAFKDYGIRWLAVAAATAANVTLQDLVQCASRIACRKDKINTDIVLYVKSSKLETFAARTTRV